MHNELPKPWSVVTHRHTARSGRERRTFTVERDTGEFVLAGFSDEPQIYRRHREAKEMADLLNAEGSAA